MMKSNKILENDCNWKYHMKKITYIFFIDTAVY